jgi:predicted nucleotide-binding protein (sugar kinase/HSP70/actin superfamily)
MLAYYYLPLWETFFKQLGAEVIVSPPTNKQIMDTGAQLAVDEACLPVKVFLGHVDYLKDKVDVLFIPRVVSVEPRKYTCPKLIGLPDMVISNIAELPSVWSDAVNLSKHRLNLYPVVLALGRRLTWNFMRIIWAFWLASLKLRRFEKLLLAGHTAEEAYAALQVGHHPQAPARAEGLTIAVVGHAYNIHDSYISMRILARLREMGVRVITPEMISRKALYKATNQMSKDLFWTYGKRILGTGYYYLQKRGHIDGIINIVAFGCGPDALVGEMLERKVRQTAGIAFMLLTIDEHTGEAGLITRLEAFVDMIRWRERSNAHYFPAYGDITPDA